MDEEGNIQWILWIALSFLSFLALEIPAIHSDPNRTLTQRLREWLGIYPKKPIRHTLVPIFVAGVIALPVWLVTHLIY